MARGRAALTGLAGRTRTPRRTAPSWPRRPTAPGDGTLANVTLDRALTSDPAYRLAHLLSYTPSPRHSPGTPPGDAAAFGIDYGTKFPKAAAKITDDLDVAAPVLQLPAGIGSI